MDYPKIYKDFVGGSNERILYYLDMEFFNRITFMIDCDLMYINESIGTVCLHREDGPALSIRYNHNNVEYEQYFHYGRHHRIAGPAVCDLYTGNCYWYVHGVSYHTTLSYCQACEYDDETTMFWILKYGELLPYKYADTICD